jgi:hypothetical protein
MEWSGKGSLKMKTKLFVLLLLLIVAGAPAALAAADGGDRSFHPERGQLLVTPVGDPAVNNAPTSPAVVPNDPKQVLQDYDSLMIALTQKFSATLATISTLPTDSTDFLSRGRLLLAATVISQDSSPFFVVLLPKCTAKKDYHTSSPIQLIGLKCAVLNPCSLTRSVWLSLSAWS